MNTRRPCCMLLCVRMASSSYSSSPMTIVGGGLGLIFPYMAFSTTGVRSAAWNLLWILHRGGNFNSYVVGEVRRVITKGPSLLWVNFLDVYLYSKFRLSNHTWSPSLNGVHGWFFRLAIFSLVCSCASRAANLMESRNFAFSLIEGVFVSSCDMNAEGLYPINSSQGVFFLPECGFVL